MNSNNYSMAGTEQHSTFKKHSFGYDLGIHLRLIWRSGTCMPSKINIFASNDQHLFAVPLENRVCLPLQVKKQWLHLVSRYYWTTIACCKDNQPLITRFFSKKCFGNLLLCPPWLACIRSSKRWVSSFKPSGFNWIVQSLDANPRW